ncbi:MAG: metallophosphoesterase [Deltaproteobacteria bacterium]|nr:metallophosphoesterase [Deltaproteobacteria bacterium]
MLSRRAFLKGGLLLGSALMVDGFLLEPREFRVEEVPVKIRGLSPEFDGFTICQVTDVHHSPFVRLGYLERVVEKANSLKPDLTVLTGDYIDDAREYVAPAIKALSGLKAERGLLSILGNHDHFTGKAHTVEAIRSHGIPLLENSHSLIESGRGILCVAGVKDYLEDFPDAKAALRGVDNDIPRILLSHHPDYAESLPGDERVDLVVSGHTHGGQIRAPFSFAPVLPSAYGQKYSGGLVTLKKRETQVYVSRGVGVVMIPVRINCPPELTLIRLSPA